MQSECECKFSDIINSDILNNNVMLSKIAKELGDFLDSNNLEVLQCYKDAFKNIIKNIGGFIILSILFLNILFTLLFYAVESGKVSKYPY